MFSQDPGDQKNLLMAILLSVAVMLAWQFFYASPKIKEEQERRQAIAAEQAKKQQNPGSGAAPVGGSAPAAPSAAPGGAAPSVGSAGGSAPVVASVSRDAALKRDARLPIQTTAITGSINLKGGRIDDIKLNRYREEFPATSPNVILFSPAYAPKPYFAEHGWVVGPGTDTKVPSRDTVWKVANSQTTLGHSEPVTLVWDNGEGVIFKRTISVDENYLFEISQTVENNSGKPLTLRPYGRIYRLGTPDIEGFFIQHEGMIGFLGEKKLQEIDYSEALEDGGGKTFNETGGWLGFTDKYWAAALVPEQTKPFIGSMRATQKKTEKQREAFQSDYLMPEVTIAPSASQTVKSHLFVGAKKVDLINKYESEQRILEFNYLIDWGWFYFITKPLYQLIIWFYDILGNFGLAILAVTVVVKAAFFWFANKSYESMAKMKKLQPELERIRERYKDDKMAQQKEMMELYKKEKINPLVGCLPMLVQIPVFFALYKVLFVAIEMRHAPFYGWIQDLSAKDPTSLFNLFGLLPYSVPDFLVIGIWPLIMGVTMWLQMQLNPQQPDPIQQQIFNWMPVMFTFLLATFPAGLVIYWAWNNVLSLAQQYLIMKRQGVEIVLFDNIKRNFGAIGKAVTGLTKKTDSKS